MFRPDWCAPAEERDSFACVFQVAFDQCFEAAVDLKSHGFAVGEDFRGFPLVCPGLLKQHKGGGAWAAAAMDEHFMSAIGMPLDEVADGADAGFRQGAAPTP